MTHLGDFTAAVEEAERDEAEPLVFDFHGKTFALADSVGVMPLWRFAAAASDGLDTDSFEGMAAMQQMLRDCMATEARDVEVDGQSVHAGGWAEFQATCTAAKVDDDELLELIGRFYRAMTGRPTRRQSDSSDGLPTTSESSTGVYSSPEQRRAKLGLVPLDEVLDEVAASSG